MNFQARQRRLQSALPEHRLDALLITHLPNIRYLCGFTGTSGALWVTPASSVFFSDGRYSEQAKSEVEGAKILIQRKSLLPSIGEWAARKHRGAKRYSLGIEGEHLSLATGQRLAKSLGGKYKVRPAPPFLEEVRQIKDDQEIEAMRTAAEAGAGLFQHALNSMKAGVPEVVVASAMEAAARRSGAEAMSFETIVAGGVRSALPHGRASEALIPLGAFVVCDFGVILHGYCSDRTRTVWVGRVTAEARQVYNAVLEAQAAAIAVVRHGVSAEKVDRAARNVLKKHGLANHFTHSTGHGVGLEIHEAPRIAVGQKECLQAGMVITIEPGVYLPGQWGVRIEDMVLVTEQGCEVLSPGPKELIAV